MLSTKESPVELWEDLSHEKWQVQHGAGKPRLMTVDEIDAAFKRDEVNARTLVRKQGSLKWRTLAEIAGLQEEVSHQLESESLMPVTSEIIIDVVNPVIPKPPPLPRRSSQDSIPTARVDVPDLGARAVPMDDDGENEKTTLVPAGDDVMVEPAPGEDGAIFHLSRPKRQASIVDHEEQKRRRSSSSTGGKLVGAAMIALVGGGVFAGVSAWLAGSFDRHAQPAAPAIANPPSAASDQSAVKTLPPVTIEGSVLVLAPTATHATATATAPAPAHAAPAAPKPSVAARAPAAPPRASATVGLKIDAKKTMIGRAPTPPTHAAKAKTH